jgi:hypothetical protein
MPKWIGNRFGNAVPIAPSTNAPSAIYNIFDQYYSRREGGWVLPFEGMTATGGIISDFAHPDGTVYRTHIFTSSGTFRVTDNGTGTAEVDYLVIGGGGAGGVNAGGGGGAGGFRVSMPGHPLTSGNRFPTPSSGGDGSGNYPVIVGGGGQGGTHPTPAANPGNDSSFGPPSTPARMTSSGGGGGAYPGNGQDGGSGGGGSPSTAGSTASATTPLGGPSVQGNDGGVTKTTLTMHGDTGDVRIHGNLTIDGDTLTSNTSTLTVEDNIIELNRNISSNSGMPNYTGLKVNRGETSSATEQNLYWVWDETFADDGSTIFGNAGGAWTAFRGADGDTELEAPTLVDIRANIVHATSTSAQYADLAERYEADCDTEVGDVVMLGGEAEITKCNEELSDAVFGVISESPAFLMNASAGNNESHPMVALKGRVLVKLKGEGRAGDRVVSAGNGEARVAAIDECTAFNTLGRLIKHKYNVETALTECVIGVK